MDGKSKDKSSKIKSKQKHLKFIKNHRIPEKLVHAIKEQQKIQNILNVMDSVKSKWHEEKNGTDELGIKSLLERNILTCASWYGHSKLVDFILTKWQTQHSNSEKVKNLHLSRVLSLPMCIAAYRGHLAIVHTLLSYVNNLAEVVEISKIESLPYWKDNRLQIPRTLKQFAAISALDMILTSDNVEMLQTFHQNKNSIHNIKWKNCFYRACVLKAEKCAEYMLSSVSELSDPNSLRYFGKASGLFSPLSVACQTSFKITTLLLNAGVDVNVCDSSGVNCLHYAIAPYCIYQEENFAVDPYRDELGVFSTLKKKVCYLDSHGPEAVFIGKEFILNSNYTYEIMQLQYRYLSFTNETVNIVRTLCEYGINKQNKIKYFSWRKELLDDTVVRESICYFKSNLRKPMEPAGTLSTLISQISTVSYPYKSVLKIYQRPSEKEIEEYCRVFDQLFSYLIEENGESDFAGELHPFNAWYLSTLHTLSNVVYGTKSLVKFGPEEEENNEEDFAVIPVYLDIALKITQSCLSRLVQLDYIPKTKFKIHWLFTKLLTIISANSFKASDELKFGVCFLVRDEQEFVKSKLHTYKKFIQETLQIFYTHGFSLGKISSLFKHIWYLSHLQISVHLVMEVLTLLCTCSHKNFYKAVNMFEKEPVSQSRNPVYMGMFNDRELFNIMDQEPAAEEDVNKPCLIQKIKALHLGENARPLAHIARVVIYESMGRRFEPGVKELTQSAVIQEYLTSFYYS